LAFFHLVGAADDMTGELPFGVAGSPSLSVLHGDRVRTYVDLKERRDAIGLDLGKRLRSTESVALVLTASVGSVAALLAAAGHRSVLLLPSTLPGAELEGFLKASGVRAALGPRQDSLAGLSDLEDAAPLGEDLVFFQLKSPRSSAKTALDSAPTGSVCQITSGSTSASRLAVRTTSALTTEIESVTRAVELSASDRVLVASSIAHSYGLMGGLLCALNTGAAVALASNASSAVSLAELWRPTVLFGLPPVYESLLASEERGWARSLRLCLSAGAPLDPSTYDSFLRFTGLHIRQDYGTTEAGTIAIDLNEPANPETVGRPLSHIQVHLVPTPGQSPQEVVVRSPAVASWYVDDTGGLESCLDSEGWFHTGDAGELDEFGNLRLQRRLRSLVAVDGRMVDPYALEQLLKRVPGIREAAVYERPDEGLRAILVASKDGEEALEALSQARQACEQQITSFEMRSALPRSPAGKVLYKYL
jgi:acyl-CoA synthetase (AMP-forming)/AMP-acid ligase II